MLALLAVAFVSGLSIGVIGDRVASRLTPVTSRPTDEISSVLDELSLTKDQRDKAETILERRAPRAEGVMVDAPRIYRRSRIQWIMSYARYCRQRNSPSSTHCDTVRYSC